MSHSHPPAEFVDLLTSSQSRLQSYIASMLSNPESTWDVLQETNRVLIEKHQQFRHGTNFLNWSLTVAQFQTMAWLRDQKRDRHVMTPEIVELIGSDGGEVDSLFKTSDERMRALKGCIEKLPNDSRDVIQQRYHDDLPLAQLAATASRSVNAIKQLLFRIRKQLAQCVERQMEIAR